MYLRGEKDVAVNREMKETEAINLYTWDSRNIRPWKETQIDKVPERHQDNTAFVTAAWTPGMNSKRRHFKPKLFMNLWQI